MGELGLEKMQNGEYFFGKKHVKLAHGRNFAPKIFPGDSDSVAVIVAVIVIV